MAQGRFDTDRDGYAAMLKVGRRHKDRVWAVEGCNGIGRHLAQRLVADGETVLDVPAKLSARARLFNTNQARKPTRPTRTASRSPPCAPPDCGRSLSMTPRWR
ncbi:hypothetical protein KZZ52_33695 [Dactylosporangium sp. AC04546]|uniref:hypothetical protein n=1 Tax=Dactylosporangium sp. AC04546 TaxID=2862460 RepID=UPI001EDEB54D|nr:hypothetical protein [Dactylosporangium sp. AC04546]WVK78929.1 hypothetical protein KZZ52_33695 [Dactylosporangium sp. AC04546]